MGGPGSGNWFRGGGKVLVEGCPSLDVNYLNRQRLLRPGLLYTMSWKKDGGEIASIGISTMDLEGDRIELTYDH